VLSIVIPTLNAERTLGPTLAPLVAGVLDGLVRECVVVDGGSTDGTLAVAEGAGCRIVHAGRGRGVQLRAGCAAAHGDWLLALHADTRLEGAWIGAVRRHLAHRPDRAGYFRLRFEDPAPIARIWEAGVAFRCAALALPFGDQGLLISRRLYEAVGGYEPLPLLEDFRLVRRLGRRRLARVDAHAVTSADRYRRDGWFRRTAGNWAILARHACGETPDALATRYDRERRA
jgi:rSAM/selenodomain-associated transferase 2